MQTLHHGGKLCARATRARLIQVIKIKGELNNSDLQTKKLRDKSFSTKADNILGSPARLDTSDSEAEADTEDEY